MFVEGVSGTLMGMDKSARTRLEFTIWFPYMRSSIRRIREGSLVAVKNFSSEQDEECYSILRITSVLPMHYALGTRRDGYPGFMEEAAINAAKDWDQRRPTQDTTKIECGAVPTVLEIRKKNPLSVQDGFDDRRIADESNMPMTGEKVYMLDSEWTTRIINKDIQDLRDDTIKVGSLTNSRDVDIMVLWDSLIRTHFGIFAYTNAGKSNLLSTVTSKIFERSQDAKIVIYDLMGEYGALLVDVLYGNPDASVVYVSLEAMPGSMLEFWKDPSNDEKLQRAAQDVVNTTILPKDLKGVQHLFTGPVQRILLDGKFKFLTLSGGLDEIVSSAMEEISEGKWGTKFDEFVDHVESVNTITGLTKEGAAQLISSVSRHMPIGTSTAFAKQAKKELLGRLEDVKMHLEATENIDDRFKVKMDELVNTLNEPGRKSLHVVQGGSDVDIRKMSYDLGMEMIKRRRREGRISPPVSFVYDEADQFIAQDAQGRFGMEDSKGIAEQLARRGRKYGLGIGIATQRIVYLDTNILGQPHTYFVSKLPRASDREKIQEAFGIPDETMSETLRFSAGQWLLVSHSATGVDGVPIPVQLPNANERIRKFLEGLVRDNGR